eukprot:388127_1
MATIIFIFVLSTAMIIVDCRKPFCTPSNSSCWPTQQQLSNFSATISGELLQSSDPLFNETTAMKNTLITMRPTFVLLPSIDDTINDIFKSITFIQKHNLLLSIYSTGHSYTGRSSGLYNYSFQINFSKHTRIVYDNTETPTTVTVETGAIFDAIYASLDMMSNKINKPLLIPAGNCATVAPGGFYLGGGHSPISGYLGLGIDSILEYKVITANSTYITATNQSNSDLFWALQGGGGGTFGIILNITIKLHYIPKNISSNGGITLFVNEYPYYLDNGTVIGDQILLNYFNLLPTFTNRVNGYVDINTNKQNGSRIIFNLLYIGNKEEAKNELYTLSEYMVEYTLFRPYYISYKSFFDWISSQPDIIDTNILTYSNLYSLTNLTNMNSIQSINNAVNETEHIINQYGNDDTEWDFVFSIIGKSATNNDPNGQNAAISPKWRQTALYLLTEFVYDINDVNGDNYNALMNKQTWNIQSYGMGSYFNENAENNTNWYLQYWGLNHYQKLVNLKNIWDQEPHLFNCHYCIGYNASTDVEF